MVDWQAPRWLDPLSQLDCLATASLGSEIELSAELQLATADGACNVGEATGVAARQPCWSATVGSEEELQRICSAKSLQTQVQIVALRKADGLRQRSIQVEKS